MNRRSFLALASGLLIPEWMLDPPKGRSMIAVPGMFGQDDGVMFYPRRVYKYIGQITILTPNGMVTQYVPRYGVDSMKPVFVSSGTIRLGFLPVGGGGA